MTTPSYDSKRHVWNAYEARYTARRTGRLLYTSAIHESRTQAAQEVFDENPTAQSCTTWRAHKQADGSWFAASDMREVHR